MSDNALVTITYPNGTILKAVVLAHDQHEIRAIVPGSEDVLVFTRTHATWTSEKIESVAIKFDWQHIVATHVPTKDDCICPKELASYLIGTLLRSDEPVEADALYIFSPQGNRVGIHRTELQLT